MSEIGFHTQIRKSEPQRANLRKYSVLGVIMAIPQLLLAGVVFVGGIVGSICAGVVAMAIVNIVVPAMFFYGTFYLFTKSMP